MEEWETVDVPTHPQNDGKWVVTVAAAMGFTLFVCGTRKVAECSTANLTHNAELCCPPGNDD